MRLLLSLLLNGLLVFFVAEILPGVAIESYLTAVITGLALGIINFFIRPVITLLTLPLTVVTFGLFLLIINGAMVFLAARLIDGFEVQGLGYAILFSVFLTLLNSILGNEKISRKRR